MNKTLKKISHTKLNEFDIVIIRGGPAGIFACK